MAAPTDPGVQAAMRESMIVELATLSAKGRPFVTPIWFVVDGGVVYMTTGIGSRAGRNVVANPAVTLLFHGERPTEEGVLRMRGVATVHAGMPPWRVLARIAAKYYLAPAALPVELANVSKWGLRARYYAQVAGGPGHIRIRPTGADFLARP